MQKITKTIVKLHILFPERAYGAVWSKIERSVKEDLESFGSIRCDQAHKGRTRNINKQKA